MPNSCAWLMIAATVAPAVAGGEESVPDSSDPVVADVVASIGDVFELGSPLSVRIDTRQRLERFAGDPEPARSVGMTRILHVLGVSTAPPIEGRETPPNPAPEESSAPDIGQSRVAVFDQASPVDTPILWIRSGPMDLSDLVLVGREAARACQRIVSRSPPPGIAVPMFSTDHPDDDRSLALRMIRSAQVEHVVLRVLREQAEEVARGGFLPPASLDSWKTPHQAAWDLAIGRFTQDVGRGYFERIVASRGENAVMPWALQPTSTSDLKHGRPGRKASFDPPRLPDRVAAAGGVESARNGVSVLGWSMGELRIELILRLAADPLRAIGASTGWVDDRIAWYDVSLADRAIPAEELDESARASADDESGLVLWHLRFENEEDAREMVDAFRKLFERRYAEQSDPGLQIGRDRADLTWARASSADRDWGLTRRREASVRFAISPTGPLPSWAADWVDERF